MPLTPLGPFLGVNNKLPVDGLRVDERYRQGNWLADAVNVIVDNGGEIRRRLGERKALDLPGAHSLCVPSPSVGYAVAEGRLHHFHPIVGTLQTLVTLSTDAPMSYVETNGRVYYSNGADIGYLMDALARPAALPTPDAPSLVAVAGGDLPPGRYRVWVSYYDAATGEPGALSPAASVDLAIAGGIALSLPPQTLGASHARLHMTAPNGEVARHAATVDLNQGSFLIASPAAGAEASPALEAPLPPGELFMANGRLCSFSGNTIHVGLPYRYGYWDPLAFIPFPGTIRLAMHNQGGTYVVADETWWIPGDLGALDAPLQRVLPYSGAMGTGFRLPDAPVVGWFGQEGLVLGDTAGKVEAITAQAVEVKMPERGCSALIEGHAPRGPETTPYTLVMSCGWSVNLTNKAATRYDNWGVTSASGGYGAKADGIYRLACERHGEMAWKVDFGAINFAVEPLKHLPSAYLGLRSGDTVWLRVEAPDGPHWEYPARDHDRERRVQRVDVGKGLKANWYRLGLFGRCDFALSTVTFRTAVSRRRI